MTKDWIAIEATTGIFDGYYSFKNDAVKAAHYLTERFKGSCWNVEQQNWNKDRPPFWRTEGIRALKTLFDDRGY